MSAPPTTHRAPAPAAGDGPAAGAEAGVQVKAEAEDAARPSPAPAPADAGGELILVEVQAPPAGLVNVAIPAGVVPGQKFRVQVRKAPAPG